MTLSLTPRSEFSYATTDYALFQRVAILFLVFAIGSAMDPASEMYNEGAERYHQLALASLFHGRPIERPTLHGVQALVRVQSPCCASAKAYSSF